MYDASSLDLRERTARVEEAAASGREVMVVYIHRSIEDSVSGAITRALRSGVVTSLGALASDHYCAQQTLLWLSNKYKKSSRVRIGVIDNTGGPENIRAVRLATIRNNFYGSAAKALRAARRAYEVEYEKRREQIPGFVTQSFEGET